MTQRVMNISDKPFLFDADGKTWVIPPKQKGTKADLYYYVDHELSETPDMESTAGGLLAFPRIHPVTKQPIMRRQWKTVVKTTDRPRKGALKVNYIMANDTVVRELQVGKGRDYMTRQGINPRDIVFGQAYVDNLDREIELKMAELSRIEAELDAKRHSELALLQEEQAKISDAIETSAKVAASVPKS